MLYSASLMAIGAAVTSTAGAQTSAPITDTRPAVASQAPELAVGDIIVTAQKRTESINRVGMSITAASADDLTRRNVTDVAQLVKIAPGFNFSPSPFGQPVYSIRGVGLYESGLASAPAVTVYTDQIPFASPVMTELSPIDIERVEILKGPQGLLFGQNATGGAVNYILARPTNEFEAGGAVTYERFGRLDGSGFVSGPLSDTVRFRVAGRAIEGGAWQRSITRPADELGDRSQWQARLLLDADVGDRLTLQLTINGGQENSETQASQVVSIAPTNPAVASPYLLSLAESPRNPRLAEWAPGNDPLRSRDRLFQSSLRADYELSDTVTLTSVTSYQHFKQNKNIDFGAATDSYTNYFNFSVPAGTPPSSVRSIGSVDSIYQELRLSGSTDTVKWIFGGNYNHQKIEDSQDFTLNQTFVQPVPILPPFEFIRAYTNQKIDEYGIFGNVDYSFTDRLTGHAGLRYTKSRRNGTACTTGFNYDIIPNGAGNQLTALQAFFASIGLKTSPIVPLGEGDCVALTALPDLSPFPGGVPVRLNEDNLSWRFGIDYRTPGNMLLYANYSRGYKAGVMSTFAASAVNEYAPAKQERLDAFELGFKAPLGGNRYHLNGAVFYYDYKDKQLRGRYLDPLFSLLEILQNIPKSRVLGVEADLQAEPIDGLRLSLSGTYLDTKVNGTYVSYSATGALGDFRGSQLPFTPKWQIIADGQYEFPVSESLNAFLGGSLSYHSKSNATFETAVLPADALALDSYVLLDAQVGLASADDKWRLTVFGRNLTNKFYAINAQKNADVFVRQAGRPLTYGATISFQFR